MKDILKVHNENKKIKVAIGMSGGIDSCVAAYILKKQGYQVTGFTLKLWDDGSRCCDLDDITRAQRFANKIGIPHYIIDVKRDFKKLIVDYFINEYLKGRTPNPCIKCNRIIKFNQLFKKLKLLNCDFAATGHYARIIKKGSAYFLSKAKDLKKSQEYFLARVEKEKLKKIIFPLGDLTKDEVRKLSDSIDFSFRNDESQEVCFIKPPLKYFEFILKNRNISGNYSGKIINKKNEILGKTDCYFKYTIGQRGGLGISGSTPNYVIRIDAEKRNIIIGKKEDVYRTSFSVKDVYWYSKPKNKANVRIRYKHTESKAVIEYKDNKMLISFISPQLAITPGQLAVFYDKNIVIGSAWIDEIL